MVTEIEQKNQIGYPFGYKDELTPSMARKNRNSIIYSSIILIGIFGFGKQTQFDSSTSINSKIDIVKVVPYGGDLENIDFEKFGPGVLGKVDAKKAVAAQRAEQLKKIERKTEGGNLFAEGFNIQQKYPARLNKNQLDFGNKNELNQNYILTKEQRRNLPHVEDFIIPEKNVTIRHGQAKFKVEKHGHDFGLPYESNEKGRFKTTKTPENIQDFKNEIKKLVLTGQEIEGTYRKGKPNESLAIHFYYKTTKCNAIFKKETKEFVSAWKLEPEQINDLLLNQNIGEF